MKLPVKPKQPQPNTNKPGKQSDTGYPQTGVKVNTGVMRGTGAAIKGKKFNNSED